MHETAQNASERDPLLQNRADVTTLPESRDDAILSDDNGISKPDSHEQRTLSLGDKLRVLTVLFTFFASGMSMTVIGAILPQLEEYYSVTDSKVAFIFTAGTVGYITGTFALSSLVSQYGWRAGAFLTGIGAVLYGVALSMAPPFPIVLLIQFLGLLSVGLMDAGFNAWSSKLPYVNVIQGFLHGSYSVGCVLGPMVHAALVKRDLPWFIFYRIYAGLSLVVMICLVLAFRTENAQKFKTDQVSIELTQKKTSSRTKVIALIGMFYFFYIAIEASFSDWLPSFMQRVRHANPATASLSASVYWIGMALGRVGLGVVTEYFGLSISVTFYILTAIGLQTAFCFVETVRTSFVLLGMNGFFLGPMFPSGIILISRSLSNEEYIGGVAAAAAIGQVGGALCPLGIGFMAEKFGLKHLSEVILTSTCLVLVGWIVSARFTRVG